MFFRFHRFLILILVLSFFLPSEMSYIEAHGGGGKGRGGGGGGRGGGRGRGGGGGGKRNKVRRANHQNRARARGDRGRRRHDGDDDGPNRRNRRNRRNNDIYLYGYGYGYGGWDDWDDGYYNGGNNYSPYGMYPYNPYDYNTNYPIYIPRNNFNGNGNDNPGSNFQYNNTFLIDESRSPYNQERIEVFEERSGYRDKKGVFFDD